MSTTAQPTYLISEDGTKFYEVEVVGPGERAGFLSYRFADPLSSTYDAPTSRIGQDKVELRLNFAMDRIEALEHQAQALEGQAHSLRGSAYVIRQALQHVKEARQA